MYFKINLQILIVIFLILLILLILFKNNLRSVFTKYNSNKRNFLVDNTGNLYSSQYTNFNPHMNDLTVTCTLPSLSGYWKDTSAVGAQVGGTLPARWWSTPLIYIFDPSGQTVAGNTMQSAYQPGGTLYNVFNKSFYNQNEMFKTAFLTTFPQGKENDNPGASALGPSTPFSETYYPPNLWNSSFFYSSPALIWSYNQNGKVGVIQNYKIYDSANSSTSDITSQQLISSVSYTGKLTVSFTFIGDYIHRSMVIGRTYIIGIAFMNTAKRASTSPSTVTNPIIFDGSSTNFIYTGYVPIKDTPINLYANQIILVADITS